MSTTSVRWGTELLINTTTRSTQADPSITALPDGRFVVAWEDYSETNGDTSGYAVRAQVFHADGTKAGAEFLVNTTTTGNQTHPAITALADGRFVVAWTDGSASGGDTSGDAVRAQVFETDGRLIGTELLVNGTTVGDQASPAVTALADGRFVVTWTDTSETGGDVDSYAVRARVFNASGSPASAEFLVNTTTPSAQIQPTVTGLADGRFVVAWTDDSGSGGDISGYAVRAQVFTADGSKTGAELLVNTSTADWQYAPSVTALADGRFVVAWTDDSQSAGDADAFAVCGQVFNADGSRYGVEFLVNTTTTSAQKSPAIAALADGRFVVAWEDHSASGNDASGYAVRAQVFAADGSKMGVELLVNSTATNDQQSATVTALADGRFVVAWTDESQTAGDTSSPAVRGQIFDPRETAVQLLGSIDADDFVGTIWGDTLWGGFGSDRLAGGAGGDLLYGEAGADTLKGDAGNDRLYGGLGNDSLAGGLGSEELRGGEGHDTLDGGLGNDALIGGTGNDVYVVDRQTDLVLEGADEGSDTVQSGAMSLDLADYADVEHAALTGSLDLDLTGDDGANTLAGNTGNNVLIGGSGIDTVSYLRAKAGVTVDLAVIGAQNTIGAGIDTLSSIERLTGSNYGDHLTGASASDVVSGMDGNDVLAGRLGNDTLLGGKGHDTLSGEKGNDSLAGGIGRDLFRFDKPLDANTNRDTITDFSVVDDSIELENAIFASLATIGVLASENFVASNTGTATEADDFILYNATTGALYYDADGTGTGVAVQFALLRNLPTITHLDFSVT